MTRVYVKIGVQIVFFVAASVLVGTEFGWAIGAAILFILMGLTA